jgi:hypothetical protein
MHLRVDSIHTNLLSDRLDRLVDDLADGCQSHFRCRRLGVGHRIIDHAGGLAGTLLDHIENDLRMKFSAPQRGSWSISSCLITPLDEKIGQFETKVLEHTRLQPACQCLLTQPGVGVTSALTIMLETGDIGRFPRIGDCTSYCRCARATHSANDKKKGPNHSHSGNACLSRAFVAAVHHAVRCRPAARRFHDKEVAKRNRAPAAKAGADKCMKETCYILK